MATKKIKLSDVVKNDKKEVQVTGYLVWNYGHYALAESQTKKDPVLYLDDSDPVTLNKFIELVFPDPKDKEPGTQNPEVDSDVRNITVTGTLNGDYLKGSKIVVKQQED